MAIFNFDSSKFSTNLNSIQSSVSSAISTAGSKFNDLVNGLSQGGMSIDGITNFVASSSKNSLLKSDPRTSPDALITGRSKAKNIGASPQSIVRARSNDTLTVDTFPGDLSDKFFFQLELAEYVRPNPMQDDSSFNTEYILNLPLPQELSEVHSVMLNASETGMMGAIANGMDRIVSNFKAPAGQNSVGEEARKSLNDAAGFGLYLSRPLLQAVGDSVPGLIGQSIGTVANPHMTVFFEGVNIRSNIEFSWILAPRNKDEAEKVAKIVKELRKRILPQVSIGAGNLMKYPMMGKITLHPWGSGGKTAKEQKWMPTYKRGLIDSLNVNWAPSGISLFNDEEAAPAFCIISFVFQEIEIFTAQDYGAGEFDKIEEVTKSAKSAVNSILSGNEQTKAE